MIEIFRIVLAIWAFVFFASVFTIIALKIDDYMEKNKKKSNRVKQPNKEVK